MDHIRP